MASVVLRDSGQLASNADQYSRWYCGARDTRHYEKALEACARVNKNLRQLNLSAEDRGLIQGCHGSTFVVTRIKALEKDILAKTEKGKKTKRVADFANAFCEVASRVAPIVQIVVPQTPEYTLPFGCLTLLFKASCLAKRSPVVLTMAEQTVAVKTEKQTALCDAFTRLSDTLPLADFYREVFPTDEMRTLVASMYIEIVDLLDRATSYYCLGSLSKLVDALIQPIEYKFDTYISNIEASKRKIFELRDAAHAAQQADMKVILDSTSAAISTLKGEMNSAFSQMASNVATLRWRFEAVEQTVQDWQRFQAVQTANRLIESFIPNLPMGSEELVWAQQRCSKLSIKDHWENNGILDPLSTWSTSQRVSLLWIGGRSGNQDCWVTELSADIVTAISSQKTDITLVSIFFDNAPNRVLTATDFVKLAITRILEQRPALVLEIPELLNTRTVRGTATFARWWMILEGAIERLSAVFFVIDRIDAAADNEDGTTAVEEILSKLLGLVSKYPDRLKVITTSTQEPPDLYKNDANLSWIWLDTGLRQAKRERR